LDQVDHIPAWISIISPQELIKVPMNPPEQRSEVNIEIRCDLINELNQSIREHQQYPALMQINQFLTQLQRFPHFCCFEDIRFQRFDPRIDWKLNATGKEILHSYEHNQTPFLFIYAFHFLGT
jgi:hypothetical protein